MATERSDLQFEIDASKLPSQINTVKRSLADLNATIDDVRKVTQTLNEKGRATEVVFEGITKAGREFTSVLSDTHKFGGQVVTTGQRINNVYSRQEKIIQGVTRAQARLIAEQARTQDLGNIRSRVTQGRLAARDIRAGEEEAILKRIIAGRLRALEIRKSELVYVERIKSAEADAQRARITQGRLSARGVRDSELNAIKQRIIAGRKAAFEIRKSERAALGLDKAQQKVARSSQEILLSWKSIGRLLVVQVLHQSIALVRQTLEEVTRQALEYEKALAEIRTISADVTETTTDWANALRQLSGQIPFKQVELAEAAYQALSNQVIQTTSDLGFLRQAGQLAVVSAGTIDQSVSALTSVLNAFDQSLLRTRQISADLFQTIVLGRTRLQQLESNLGRVSILSAQLGVSFREQQSALATLTIQGLKDNVSKTLLVNIYNKLIRPSERMQEIFKEWGVSSGEAAIATFGLTGVMNKLFDIAKRSGDEVAELGEIFQRVRGTIGALGLNTSLTEENLEKFNHSLENFEQRLAAITEERAVKLQQQLVRLNNLMLKLGDGVLSLFEYLGRLTGGFDRLVIIATKAGAVLLGIVAGNRIAAGVVAIQAAFAGVTAAIGAATTAAGVFNLLMGGLPLLLGVIGGGLAYLTASSITFGAEVQIAIDAAVKKFTELNDKVSKEGRKALEDWVKELDKSLNQIKTSFAVVGTELQKMLNALEVDLKRAFKNLKSDVSDYVKAANKGLDDQISKTQKLISKNERLAQQSKQRAEQLVKERQSLQEEVAVREAIARGRGQNFFVRARLLEQTGTDAGINQAKSIFEQVRDNEVAPARFRIDAANEVLRIEDKITRIKQKQIDLLNEQAAKAEKDRQRAEARAAADKQRLDDLKFAKAEFARAGTEFADFDVEGFRAGATRPGKLGESIEDKVKRIRDAGKLTETEFTRLGTNLLDSARAADASPEQIIALVEKLRDARSKLIADIQNDIQQATLKDIQANTTRQLEFIRAAQKKAEDNVAEGLGLQDRAQEEIVSVVTEIQENIGNVGSVTLKDLLATEEKISKERGKAIVDEEKLNELIKHREELLKIVVGFLNSPNTQEAFNLENVDALTERLTIANESFNRGLSRVDTGEGILVGLDTQFNNLIRQLGSEGLLREQQTTAVFDNTKSLKDSIKAMGELRRAIENRQGFATGGYVTGPGGIDNVPAMLTAGEFVMNAKATRQFLPVLRAMNNPQRFNSGGRVQNFNFGDIQIQGGNTNKETTRSLVTAIKREIKRGTISL